MPGITLYMETTGMLLAFAAPRSWSLNSSGNFIEYPQPPIAILQGVAITSKKQPSLASTSASLKAKFPEVMTATPYKLTRPLQKVHDLKMSHYIYYCG